MTKLHNEQVNDKRNYSKKELCDVLIVGGGPAGSTCARQLVRSGYDVVILDRAEFPRPKTCGGWVTPQVVEELEISLDEYGSQYELQPIEGFRTGLVGDDSTVDTCYERTVSYGIRRIEFDNYLLQRSGARLHLGESLDSIERQAEEWLINDRYQATFLIGAGGNFCPVARHFNQESKNPEHIVRAQEAEFMMSRDQAGKCRVQPNRPELYFFPDLKGYAWCFRKHDYLNVGLGGMGYAHLSAKKDEYLQHLRETRRLGFEVTAHFKGHAYRLQGFGTRKMVDDGMLLIGDAAGLAYPQSGEGIRPAVESGILAAQTIVECDGRYERDSLDRYQLLMNRHFGKPIQHHWWESVPPSLRRFLARRLFRSRSLTRNILIDRWFLQTGQPALKPLPVEAEDVASV